MVVLYSKRLLQNIVMGEEKMIKEYFLKIPVPQTHPISHAPLVPQTPPFLYIYSARRTCTTFGGEGNRIVMLKLMLKNYVCESEKKVLF